MAIQARLGADYVKAGERQVFAQLSFPVDSNGDYDPYIYVQTRWREYDAKRQVAGAVYNSGCTEFRDISSVVVTSKPVVSDVQMTDLGNGQILLDAKGEFYSPTTTVLSGTTAISPTLFDGKHIRLVASAQDLLAGGDLVLVGPGGQRVPFGIQFNPSKEDECRMTTSEVFATPYPDGNSRAKLILEYGAAYNYDRKFDGVPHPLVMVGGKVYGLKETPFAKTDNVCERVMKDDLPEKTICTYQFVAPTTDIRNAQNYIVRDLTWSRMSSEGKVDFQPSLASITGITADKVQTPPASTSLTTIKGSGVTTIITSGMTAVTGDGVTSVVVSDANAAVSKRILSLSGYDLSKFAKSPICPDTDDQRIKATNYPCIQILFENDPNPIKPSDADFNIQTDNVAIVTLNKAKLDNAKNIRFQIIYDPPKAANDLNSNLRSRVEWSLALPKTDKLDPVATPAFLRVGDSQKVSFRDSSLMGYDTVTFEGTKIDGVTYDVGTSSLVIPVTSVVTKLYGRKEFIATSKDGSKKPRQLWIDVVRQ